MFDEELKMSGSLFLGVCCLSFIIGALAAEIFMMAPISEKYSGLLCTQKLPGMNESEIQYIRCYDIRVLSRSCPAYGSLTTELKPFNFTSDLEKS